MSNIRRFPVFLVSALLLMPVQAGQSAELDQGLVQRIESMERGLKTMKRQLEDAKRNAENAKKQASAESDKLSKWHLAGYTNAVFTATDAAGVDSKFGSLKFNPVIHYQYSDFILFEGELEFELADDGTTDTALEYASIDILAHDWVTIVTGKFLSPVGQFQERLHPGWVNKAPDAPAGFGHGGAQPLSDFGVMLRGGIPVSDMILSYSVAVGNGPRISHHGPELKGYGTDDNNNKAVSGRVGIQPIPHLEFGASFMTAEIEGEAATSGSVTAGDYDLWGLDVAYTKGAWDVRAEYLNSKLGSFYGQEADGDATTSLIPSTKWEAWYAQLAYQLSGLTKAQFLRNFELVARYGEIDIKGHGEFREEVPPEERLTFGVNYLFAPSVILKTAFSLRNYKDESTEDAAEVKVQLTYGF